MDGTDELTRDSEMSQSICLTDCETEKMVEKVGVVGPFLLIFGLA